MVIATGNGHVGQLLGRIRDTEAYVAYQRIGTRANVGNIQSFENLAGGFLALGMTEDQPGVLILSRIEKAKVRIDATLRRNALSGDMNEFATFQRCYSGHDHPADPSCAQ